MLKQGTQRGDTIIEVILAVTVFSLLAVVVITVMNQASNTAQRALEITLVRQQIDAQAEAIRAAHQAYTRMQTKAERDGSTWHDLTAISSLIAPLTVGANCPSAADLSSKFVMNPGNAKLSNNVRPVTDSVSPLPPYANVSGSTSYGIWIEPDKESAPGGSSIPDVYSFRIRACWDGPGLRVPNEIETIVRLYDVDI